MKDILVYDTTLRDGAQGEDISFSFEEKLRILKILDELGMPYIEGGWPGSNPRDKEFFKLAKDVKLKNAMLTAFGSTRKPGVKCDEDDNLKELVACGVKVVTIFGKSWLLHVEDVLGTNADENLVMIEESVAWLKTKGLKVIYDAEHFYDGYQDNSAYALMTLEKAFLAGAEALVLCDTNGGTMPQDIERITLEVNNWLCVQEENFRGGILLGIHTHNDCGLAVANTMSAVRAGANMVQGTINGYGERCGNADLTSVIPILQVKMNFRCISAEQLANLKKTSHSVSEIANMTPWKNRPFVGQSAFAHKGGVHADAIMKNPLTYEHMEPEIVGNKRRVLVSDLSGKSNIEYKAEELGLVLGGNGHDSKKLAEVIKKLENEGYSFDAADGSLKMLVNKLIGQHQPAFELKSFRVVIEKDGDKPCSAKATIIITKDGQEEMTAAEGYGPVNALDNALRKALGKFYPDLDGMSLTDYKVRVINGQRGTAAQVRVLLESRGPDDIWTTMGVSPDIIEASWQALADSFHVLFHNDSQKQEEII